MGQHRSRTRRWVGPLVGPVLAAALLVTACGSGDDTETAGTTTSDDVGGQTSTDPSNTSSSTTDTNATNATDATNDTEPPTTAGPQPAGNCPSEEAQKADVDGDGEEDRVVHRMEGDAPVLRICTTSVGVLERPGVATGEFLDLIDIEQDGRYEILFGGTTAGALSAQLAQVVNGTLVAPTLPDGTPLVVFDGSPSGLPPDGPRYAYGCGDGNGDDLRDLFVMQIDIAEESFTSELRWFALRDGIAVLTSSSTQSGQFPGDDPVEGAQQLVDQYIDPC